LTVYNNFVKNFTATDMQKPSIPKGTRDFTPTEMVKREFIFFTIKEVFKKYGYAPIETPAMENLSTLLGKYGEEGDKLLFKILNSGDFLKKGENTDLNVIDSNTLSQQISEKGLRYDLTVPFARFVVQHREEITFPFKRYQVQPVWRADRPQKGRYREFYQCDVDVIGSNSLLNELELIQIIEEVFRSLEVNVTLKLNNRKILAGIAQSIGSPERLTDITIAIDKIEKIGLEKVLVELGERNLPPESVEKLVPFLMIKGNSSEILKQLRVVFANCSIGLQGIDEMETIFGLVKELDVNLKIDLDLTLARGLNYYTGAIFEVKANDMEIGSICGGGRYDDLTGIFGLKDVSGVGISFGADRIYDVLNQLALFPDAVNNGTQIMLVNFGEKEQPYCLKVLKQLRNSGIGAEMYPDSSKLNKQMNYANAKQIPFVILIGDQEIAAQKCTLKDMIKGEQYLLDINEIITKLK
jgi:histidyl-tRNA synthetase